MEKYEYKHEAIAGAVNDKENAAFSFWQDSVSTLSTLLPAQSACAVALFVYTAIHKIWSVSIRLCCTEGTAVRHSGAYKT